MRKKKIFCIIPLLIVCLFCFACQDKKVENNGENNGENNDKEIIIPQQITLQDVNISTINSTYKVMQNESITSDSGISLDVVKGEYEGYQIIIKAKEDIASYDITLSDLTSGEEVYSKDNIALFHQKYIDVKNNFEGTSAPTGMYPDALIPLKNIIEAKENKIAKDNNQGVYVRFFIPTEQKAGLYKGSLRINFGSVHKDLPITLNIHDITLSQTTHLKSKFNIFDQYYLGELDSTQDMLDTYINFLGEYRLSPGAIVQGRDGGRDETVEKAYEIMQNPKLASFAIPAGTKYENGLLTLNNDSVASYLNAMVDKCIEKYNKETKQGFNLLSKVVMTASLIDEPDQTGRMHLVPGVLKNFHKGVKQSLDYITKNRAKWTGVDKSFIDDMYNDIKDFDLILSMSFHEEVNKINNSVEFNDCGEVIFCPYISDYGDIENRKKYDGIKDKWAYVCNNPKPPFPTYHIEDNLLSSRILGWELSEYDIKGLFYWASELNGKFDKTSGYQPIEDKFQTADRYPGCNGDGFIMYPGASYGIYGPVPSIRIESIRDGMEEYELWYELKNLYKAKGLSASDIQHEVSSILYNEAKVFNNNDYVVKAREYLFTLLSLAHSKEQVFISSVKEENDRTIYTIKVADGVVIEGQGVKKINNTTFTLTVNNLDKNNSLKFNVKKGEKTTQVDMNLVGSVNKVDINTINNTIVQKDGKLTKKVANDKVELSIANVKNSEQSFSLTGDIISALKGDVKQFKFKIDNRTNKAIPLSIYAHYNNGRIINIFNTTLKVGENVIEFNQCASTDWKKYGGYKSLNVYLTSDKGNYEGKNISIYDMKINKF